MPEFRVFVVLTAVLVPAVLLTESLLVALAALVSWVFTAGLGLAILVEGARDEG